MYDKDKRTCIIGLTVGEIINELSELPLDAEFQCCGDSMFYIHVKKDESAISIDTNDLKSEY